MVAKVIATVGPHSVAETVECLRGLLERRSITVFVLTSPFSGAIRASPRPLPDPVNSAMRSGHLRAHSSHGLGQGRRFFSI
jgi:hypothetical protein